MQNLADYLLTRDLSDDCILSYYNHKSYTLGNYKNVVEKIIYTLDSLSVPRNTSAILVLPDSPLTFAIFLAFIKYGIVPLLISTYTMDELLDKIINISDASILVTDGSKDTTRYGESLILVEIFDKCTEADFDLKINNLFKIKNKFVNAEEIAFFMMTSGSTGEPKIVIHNHGGMQFVTDVYAKDTLGITSKDIIYSASKSSFGYGLANNLFFPFATGASAIIYREDFTVAGMMKYFKEYSPTMNFAIPSIYRLVMRYIDDHPEDKKLLNSVRSFLSAGEKLSKDLAKAWKEFSGKFLMDNMASSEASAILLNMGDVRKYGSSGRPIKGSDVFLLDSNGNESRTGTLYFRSIGNAVGYYNNEEETKAHFEKGCLKTGDVFKIDEDGYYWYIGREDNLLKYHGFWILPEEIEDKIKEFSGVKNALVFKVNISNYDQLASALEINSSFSGEGDLKSFLLQHLEEYKCPRCFICYENFPLNNRNKVDLKQLKEAAIEVIDK